MIARVYPNAGKVELPGDEHVYDVQEIKLVSKVSLTT